MLTLTHLQEKIFILCFFVDISNGAQIQQYPGTVKVDYSRLRESGIRTAFEDFNFKITGESVVNVIAPDPFLTSLQQKPCDHQSFQ